jgi:DNA-binding CsgD family transcriptional regulator
MNRRHLSVLPAQHAGQGPSCAAIEALVASAGREVLVMSRLDTPGRHPMGGIRRIDPVNVRRGVRYRVIVPDTARTEPGLTTRLGTWSLSGVDARTVADVPTDALVIDGSVVVLPSDPDTSRPTAGTVVLRLPSVVTTTIELFERVWSVAVPLVASEVPGTDDLRPRERELLSLLSVGCTDESAAARLDVSVRTVRRMVADIMNRLGARSRFQAGVKAADRGWLMERAG